MQVRRIPGWTPDDVLEHKAIKGQKKGVRRYQYANGTYTPAGNERYRPKKSMLARVTGINVSEEGLMMVGVGAAAAGLVLASGVVSLPAIGTTAASLSGKGAVSALLANETFRNIVLPSIGAMSIANMVEKILDDELGHSDYLEHHGIKGQKWGVKHGPPYPLDTVYSGTKGSQKIALSTSSVGKVTAKDMLEINDRNCVSLEDRIKTNRINNCAKCCAALDLRLRGMKNVYAQPSINGFKFSKIETWYKNAPKTYSRQPKDIESLINKMGDGARGFTGIIGHSASGIEYKHAIYFYNEKGHIKFYDTQTRKICNSMDDVLKLYRVNANDYMKLFRTDNLEPDLSKMKADNVYETGVEKDERARKNTK